MSTTLMEFSLAIELPPLRHRPWRQVRLAFRPFLDAAAVPDESVHAYLYCGAWSAASRGSVDLGLMMWRRPEPDCLATFLTGNGRRRCGVLVFAYLRHDVAECEFYVKASAPVDALRAKLELFGCGLLDLAGRRAVSAWRLVPVDGRERRRTGRLRRRIKT